MCIRDRPIISGDGIIPQIERFAGKYVFTKLNIRIFETALQTFRQQSSQCRRGTFYVTSQSSLVELWKAMSDGTGSATQPPFCSRLASGPFQSVPGSLHRCCSRKKYTSL